MNKKPTKPIAIPTTQMSEAQKKQLQRQQVTQELLRQRTQISVNILCNIVQGRVILDTGDDGENVYFDRLVDLAVRMTDRLMDKLYGGEDGDRANE